MRIRLDVGGILFSTSKETLTRFESSMLCKWFESEMIKKEDDGTYFIDRDGNSFRIILEYLRDSISFDPSHYDELTLKNLLKEANYYQLLELVEILNNAILLRKASNFDAPVEYKVVKKGFSTYIETSSPKFLNLLEADVNILIKDGWSLHPGGFSTTSNSFSNYVFITESQVLVRNK